MSFNAEKAEIVGASKLKPDELYTAVITDVNDGKVKEFIPESAQEGWKGDINSPALNVTAEIKEGEETMKVQQMFTYIEEEGKTKVSDRSNLGKYKKKYGKFPAAGDQVKVLTNSDGFGKIKIE